MENDEYESDEQVIKHPVICDGGRN